MSTSTPKRRQPNAAQVSVTLSKAGHPKAGPYQTFGSRTPGFIVSRHHILGHVTVLYTGSYSSRGGYADVSAALDSCAETLTAVGYNVVPDVNRDGYTRSLSVVRWND